MQLSMQKLILILPVFILLSCSVQKRIYQKGYTLTWNKAKPSSKENNSSVITRPAQKALPKTTELPETQKDVMASAAKNNVPCLLKKEPVFFLKSEDSCDVILFKDGKEQRVKIIELSSAQIKYKKCDMPDGPLYIKNKTDLFMITYANGTKKLIKTEVQVLPPPVQVSSEQPRHSRIPGDPISPTYMATSALVFSLIGVYPLFLPASIVGLILSSIQLSRIQSDPERYSGERRAKVAQIISIAGIIVSTFLYFMIAISGGFN